MSAALANPAQQCTSYYLFYFYVRSKMYQNLLYKHRSKVNVNTQLPLGMNMKLLRRYFLPIFVFFQNYIFLVTFLHIKINLKIHMISLLFHNFDF